MTTLLLLGIFSSMTSACSDNDSNTAPASIRGEYQQEIENLNFAFPQVISKSVSANLTLEEVNYIVENLAKMAVKVPESGFTEKQSTKVYPTYGTTKKDEFFFKWYYQDLVDFWTTPASVKEVRIKVYNCAGCTDEVFVSYGITWSNESKPVVSKPVADSKRSMLSCNFVQSAIEENGTKICQLTVEDNVVYALAPTEIKGEISLYNRNGLAGKTYSADIEVHYSTYSKDLSEKFESFRSVITYCLDKMLVIQGDIKNGKKDASHNLILNELKTLLEKEYEKLP